VLLRRKEKRASQTTRSCEIVIPSAHLGESQQEGENIIEFRGLERKEKGGDSKERDEKGYLYLLWKKKSLAPMAHADRGGLRRRGTALSDGKEGDIGDPPRS